MSLYEEIHTLLATSLLHEEVKFDIFRTLEEDSLGEEKMLQLKVVLEKEQQFMATAERKLLEVEVQDAAALYKKCTWLFPLRSKQFLNMVQKRDALSSDHDAMELLNTLS